MKRILILILLSLPFGLFAQESIDVQRPTLTESHTLVGPKVIQFENGVQYQDTMSTFAVFARFGINDRLEFRLFSDLASPNIDLNGKVLLYNGNKYLPGVSLTVNYNIKEGSNNTRLCLSNDLGPLFYTVNIGRTRDWYGIGLLGVPVGTGSIFAEYQLTEGGIDQQNFGVTWVIAKELQVDAHAGLIEYEDFYFGAGISFRVKAN